MIATVLVVIYMLATYGVFGLIANVALLVHVCLIFGLMSVLGATMTLPGIAGIVLTIGTAVDSNVLIYERMREEEHQGRSSSRRSRPASSAPSPPSSTPTSPC
jgi:SecD/SecF fusion protein